MDGSGKEFGRRLVPPKGKEVPPEGKEQSRAPETLVNQRTENFRNLRRVERSNPGLKDVLDEWRNLAVQGNSGPDDMRRRGQLLMQINAFIPENQAFGNVDELPLVEKDLPVGELGS